MIIYPYRWIIMLVALSLLLLGSIFLLLQMQSFGAVVMVTSGTRQPQGTVSIEAQHNTCPPYKSNQQFSKTRNVIIESIDIETQQVVLRNRGTTPQDMSGWYMLSATTLECFVFPKGYVLQSNATIILVSGNNAIDKPPAQFVWSKFRLHYKNVGGGILFDANGDTVDANAWVE